MRVARGASVVWLSSPSRGRRRKQSGKLRSYRLKALGLEVEPVLVHEQPRTGAAIEENTVAGCGKRLQVLVNLDVVSFHVKFPSIFE